MKVLHLVSNLNKGGAEKQLYMLASHSYEDVEHEVLAIQAEGPWASRLRDLGVPVTCWFAGALNSPSLVPRISAETKRRTVDILHCWLPSMNLLGGMAAQLCGPARPRVIASIRNVDDWKPRWRVLVDRLASCTWDAAIVNSRAGIDCARLQGLPPAKLSWIPNGIEPRRAPSPAERAEARRRFGLLPEQPVLASVSRLVPQKRVDLVLRIAAQLHSTFPALRLLIAGDGPEVANLKRLAAALMPERALFLGSLPDPSDVLAAADAFVMTSEREGTSNALLEAMQAGCPCFATPVGDNLFLMGDPPCGSVASPADLTAAIARVLSNPLERETLRQRAAERAGDFSAGNMVGQTIRLYRSLLPIAAPRIRRESRCA